jgi:hypothetical protein
MASTSETMTRAHHAPEESGRPLKRAATWGIVLGLAAAAVWFLFLRDGEAPRNIALPKPGEISSSAAAPEAAAPEAAAPEASAKSGRPAAAPVETFKVFAPKDPFDPLVKSQTAATSGGTKGGTGRQASSVGSHSVKLAGIVDSASVRITVDGTEYLVGVNETFAESFKVLTIGPRCVSLLHGDEQLELC